MSEIAAVLFVPSDGNPDGLLAGGVCGARPPVAIELSRGTWWGGTIGAAPTHHGQDALDGNPVALWEVQHGRRALVVAWDSGPVRPGCWVVVDAMEAHDDSPGLLMVLRGVREALAGIPRGMFLLKRYAVALGCDLVFIDSKGKEVRP